MTIKELADRHQMSKSGIRRYVDQLPAERKAYVIRRGQSVVTIDDEGAQQIANWIAENNSAQPHSVEHTAHNSAQDREKAHTDRERDSTSLESASTQPNTDSENSLVCTPNTTALLTTQTALNALTGQLQAQERQIEQLQATITAQQATIATLTAIIDRTAPPNATAPEPHQSRLKAFWDRLWRIDDD